MSAKSQIEQLLESVANTLNVSVSTVRRHVEETGELPNGAPALINVARQFVKDSGIEILGTENEDVQSINDQLPDFDDNDGQVVPMNKNKSNQ